MRVLRFAWHLFWAARRTGYSLDGLLLALQMERPACLNWTDTELTEALRRYGR